MITWSRASPVVGSRMVWFLDTQFGAQLWFSKCAMFPAFQRSSQLLWALQQRRGAVRMCMKQSNG